MDLQVPDLGSVSASRRGTAPGTWRGITPGCCGQCAMIRSRAGSSWTAWPPRQHWQAGCCWWRS